MYRWRIVQTLLPFLRKPGGTKIENKILCIKPWYTTTYASTTSPPSSTTCEGRPHFSSNSSKYSLLFSSVSLQEHTRKFRTRAADTQSLLEHTHCHVSSRYLLIVRSLANPSSLSTHRSGSSLFREREDLGELFRASATVTMFSNSSIGAASAVHSSLALFSYITWKTSVPSGSRLFVLAVNIGRSIRVSDQVEIYSSLQH
jgi:hypothetical protein